MWDNLLLYVFITHNSPFPCLPRTTPPFSLLFPLLNSPNLVIVTGEGKKKQEEIEQAKKTINELEANLKRTKEEMDETKKQLLEADLKARMGRDECERLLKHTTHSETLQTECAITMKKDRDEIDKLRKSLLEVESQARRDGDELVRLSHALTDITTAKNAVNKQVNDMDSQLKKLREESEREKRYCNRILIYIYMLIYTLRIHYPLVSFYTLTHPIY